MSTPDIRAARAAQRQALIDAGAIASDRTGLEHELDDEYRPEVAPSVRAGVYWTTLGVAAVSALASGIAGIWAPDIAPQVLATAGVASSVMGIIGGGVGVIYRPSN
ncbi:hypothetical protein [Microbacterium sp. NPDC057650]|uniref:hypothetical protein n=1 Tax=unclassified Microbacterium TaxID=2609290 RepID=UPI00366FB7E4